MYQRVNYLKTCLYIKILGVRSQGSIKPLDLQLNGESKNLGCGEGVEVGILMESQTTMTKSFDSLFKLFKSILKFKFNNINYFLINS
jgi:hypothetical protein